MRIEIEKEDLRLIVSRNPGLTTSQIVRRFWPEYASHSCEMTAARGRTLTLLKAMESRGEIRSEIVDKEKIWF